MEVFCTSEPLHSFLEIRFSLLEIIDSFRLICCETNKIAGRYAQNKWKTFNIFLMTFTTFIRRYIQILQITDISIDLEIGKARRVQRLSPHGNFFCVLGAPS